MKKLSVIVEWKNQDFAEDRRASAMIEALTEQWTEFVQAGGIEGVIFNQRCELLFVVDCKPAREHLMLLISNQFGKENPVFDLRIIDGPGLSYYHLKHQGAITATGNILVFLDSDVIPEERWLVSLLSAILEPEVEIVCGNTYIELDGVVGKTFAAFWFFPLRSEFSGIEAGVQCTANNLACSAEFYRNHPFTDVPGSNRGSLVAMRRQLTDQGILMYCCHNARVAHPAPSGFVHFVVRSIGRGRNMYFTTLLSQPEQTGILLVSLRWTWSNLCRGYRRVIQNYTKVGLKWIQLPLSLLIVGAYYSLAGVGCLLTHLAPDYMKAHFQF